MADVAHEPCREVGDRDEDTSSNNVALDLCEPQLDLVQPGRVSRSEVQMHVWMIGEKLLDSLCLVRRKVVSDYVNLFAARLIGDDVS